jgi:hypothetical protein
MEALDQIYSRKNFLYQSFTRQYREVLFTEVLSILILLYGQHLQEGTKSIKDYGDITAAEINREILVRTLMVESKIRGRKQRREDKRKKGEQDTLNTLLKMAR